MKENNTRLYTVFVSSNKLLTIISVTPFWAVALKLVRYTKWDPGDICLLLLLGSVTQKGHWTAEQLEGWIKTNCSAMNYHHWDSARLMDMKQKIGHAIALISSLGSSIMAQSSDLHFSDWKKLQDYRTSFKAGRGKVEGLTHSAIDHHPSSKSNVAMPSTAGIPWAGPASDALAARSSLEPELDISYRSFEEPQSHFRTASTKDQKRVSRRKAQDLERREHMRRRSNFMLRADEPDDSDASDGADCNEHSGTNHGRAPLIPMYIWPNSVATLLDAPTMALYQWGPSSAYFDSMSVNVTSTHLAPPPPIPDPRTLPSSQTWPLIASHGPPPPR
ncbi:hypothetical protein GGU11DRAFT_400094 [Lentinula aff. detonsa]|nr:hypothetical protein GGU11DRAFT_400094 [Lentinula aff. detonsa]